MSDTITPPIERGPMSDPDGPDGPDGQRSQPTGRTHSRRNLLRAGVGVALLASAAYGVALHATSDGGTPSDPLIDGSTQPTDADGTPTPNDAEPKPPIPSLPTIDESGGGSHELWSADDMMPPSSFLTLDGNRRDLTRSIDDIVTGLLWIDSQGPQGLEENNYEQFFANGDALRQAREFFDVESGTRSGPYLKNIKKKEANGVKGADFANILTSELLLPDGSTTNTIQVGFYDPSNVDGGEFGDTYAKPIFATVQFDPSAGYVKIVGFTDVDPNESN